MCRWIHCPNHPVYLKPDSKRYSFKGFGPFLILFMIWMRTSASLHAQHQTLNGLYGQTGIVVSPVAYLQPDQKITVGAQFVPAPQAHLGYSKKNNVGEKVFFARIGFLPWAEASIRLVHPEKAKKGSYGIGDRSVFLKFRLLKEHLHLPAIAVGVYDPIGTRLLPASFVVASKSFHVMPGRVLQASTGYGVELFKDDDYLIKGFFAGCQYLPAHPPASLWPQWSAGAEYQQRTFNFTVGLHAFSFLQLNVYFMEFRNFALSASGSIML